MSLGTDLVVAKEVAWLQASGDGLPGLVKANLQDTASPFDIVSGYWPRQEGRKRGVYVTRTSILMTRNYGGGSSLGALNRTMSRHAIKLRVWWPVGRGDAVVDQSGMDVALDLLVQRVIGPALDKTHGGRFLSAAEGQEGVRVVISDAETALTRGSALTAEVLYVIDDHELAL